MISLHQYRKISELICCPSLSRSIRRTEITIALGPLASVFQLSAVQLDAVMRAHVDGLFPPLFDEESYNVYCAHIGRRTACVEKKKPYVTTLCVLYASNLAYKTSNTIRSQRIKKKRRVRACVCDMIALWLLFFRLFRTVFSSLSTLSGHVKYII